MCRRVLHAIDPAVGLGKKAERAQLAAALHGVSSKTIYTVQTIQVFDMLDNGRLAFHAEAGRMGFDESAEIDFLGFASGVIGASYVVVHDAALRLAGLGARVLIRSANGVREYNPVN